jgi:hypothetical protein
MSEAASSLSLNLPDGSASDMYVPPPVPIAAAAAVLSIASSIKGFFDAEDQKKTQKEILNKLSEIQLKIDDMDKKLDIIIERFAELEFHIDQKFEEQRTIDVITAIKRINQHYPTWIQKGYKPGRNPSVPAPAQILEELRRTTTALRETPSYVNFSTVALAMAYERLMLTEVFHVKRNDADMQRGFAQYAAYFQDAASANAEARNITVGFRWAQANTDWDSFQDAFNKRPRPLRCDVGGICCEQPSNWWYVGRLLYRYDGDLISGFTRAAEESTLKYGPGGTALALCYNSDHPAFPRRTGCPTNVGIVPTASPIGTCDLDQQHTTALTKKQAVDDLTSALDSLKMFNEKAQEWSGVQTRNRKFPDPRATANLDLQAKNPR